MVVFPGSIGMSFLLGAQLASAAQEIAVQGRGATLGQPLYVGLEWVFWCAAAIVLYAYAGYPALLHLLSRLRSAPAIRKSDITPHVTLVIVVHNEEAQIERKLRNCLALDYPEELLDILVVSDGSLDGTEDIVSRFATRGVEFLSVSGPSGKAAALNQAVPRAKGDILVFSDVRQELAADAIRELVANFGDPSIGAVSGELHLAPSTDSAAGRGVGLYWRYEKFIRRTESRLDSTVGVTGAIYALRRSLYRALDPCTILDDVAIPMEVVRAGYRVVFERKARAFDHAPDNAEHEYRRKVRTLAGNYQLVVLHPEILYPHRNRLFWQFVSHKLLRPVVPWCLLALMLTSAILSFRGG